MIRARTLVPGLVLALSLASPALACTDPVCLVDNDSLRFTRTVTFDDLPSGFGVGREVTGLLHQDGVSFGEHFVGQLRQAEATFDRIAGLAANPLQLIDGGPGQSLGIMRLYGTSVLHGHGPEGFPRPQAVGEGAIALLFDRDQAALAFDIRGGEAGWASVSFLRRDGTEIVRLRVTELGEQTYTFLRRGEVPDIAGVVLENADPEGVGIDNLRFEFDELIGALPQPLGRHV